MIEGYCQYNYKRAILNVLEAWGGEAYGHKVIDALMNGPNEFKLELTAEEKAKTDNYGQNVFRHHCHAARRQLVKEGYIKKVQPNKRGIWTRTQKAYIPSDY